MEDSEFSKRQSSEPRADALRPTEAEPSGARGFAQLIRYWREHAGLSLSQAAKLIGISKAHLWDLEDRRARNPTVKTLGGLARAYNASLPYMARLAYDALADCPPGVAARCPEATADGVASGEADATNGNSGVPS